MWGPEPLMKQGSGRLFGHGKDGPGLIRQVPRVAALSSCFPPATLHAHAVTPRTQPNPNPNPSYSASRNAMPCPAQLAAPHASHLPSVLWTGSFPRIFPGLPRCRHGSLKQEKPWWGGTIDSVGPYVLLVLLAAAGLAYCVLPSAKAAPGELLCCAVLPRLPHPVPRQLVLVKPAWPACLPVPSCLFGHGQHAAALLLFGLSTTPALMGAPQACFPPRLFF